MDYRDNQDVIPALGEVLSGNSSDPHFDRNQAYRMIGELRNENPNVKTLGYGAGARYYWQESD